ncbi:hypothetical protein [Mucilaginibacter paludis]|uniref:Uncharacterized protein n=1 Tax=Mucilaginibacter paludis DSM 18603 TaxID=714943 RepID=H1Y145_9SPHI|nr:hypothetical protein [Mucilaginibacter paludis]EHQ29680.1 hypothetical protein Mucpa_5611 [Mucilaginibacter paludis DSM 18603]
METLVKDKKDEKVNNAPKTNPVTEENKNPKFVSGNPVNKDSSKPAETEKPKEEPKAEPAKTAEQPQAEHAKPTPEAEQVKPQPIQPVLNLEGTLKLVEELHRRKIQRDKLIETINNLDGFEFDLKEEMDETGGNIYQGCTLTIEDDNRQKFTTKNPTIIWTVSQMVNRLCVDKLAEIEAGIIIPSK